MSKGKLVVIDGLDGSGKATQTGLLFETLLSQGRQVKRLSFPDYRQPSSALVKMYLSGEFGGDPSAVNAYAASSFYAVDRYASYLKFWKEDYERGGLFLADRYTTSNAIYQMVKSGREDWNNYLDWLQDYEYGKLGLPRPDCVLYLDMPTEISQKLMSKRYQGDESKKDLHESNVEFLRQCREAALYSAKRLRWHVIACAKDGIPRTIEEIHHDICDVWKGVWKDGC